MCAAVVGAALAAPPVAAAKEVQRVQLCGASRCFTFDRGNAGGKLALFAQTGGAARAPARAGGWYRLRTRIGAPGMKPVVFESAYVPRAGLIRLDDEGGGGYAWYAVNPEIAPVLRTAAGRLAPRSPASLHVSDMAPGVPAPAATAAPPPAREGGAGGRWWVGLGLAGVAAAVVLGLRRVQNGPRGE